VESGSPGFTFGFDLNPELLRMSLEGSLSQPPPVVFVEPIVQQKCGSEHGQPSSRPPTPPSNLRSASEEVKISLGETDQPEEDTVEENGEEDYEEEEGEYEEEDEVDWEEGAAMAGLPSKRGGGGGDMVERRNFNYDVIVDFVYQGRHCLPFHR